MAAGAASRPRDLAAMATAEAEALFPSSGHVRRSRRPSRRGPSAALGAAMAARLLPVLRFVVKGSLAGAAVYVAYDQGLLGSGAEGAEALKKAQAALPPAVKEWTSYMGWELPPAPSLDFSPSDSWNKGVHTVMSALSVAPSRACEYTSEGWKYVKDLVK